VEEDLSCSNNEVYPQLQRALLDGSCAMQHVDSEPQ